MLWGVAAQVYNGKKSKLEPQSSCFPGKLPSPPLFLEVLFIRRVRRLSWWLMLAGGLPEALTY